MSLKSDLKSTELFVSNQFAKSSGIGKLLASTSSEVKGTSPARQALTKLPLFFSSGNYAIIYGNQILFNVISRDFLIWEKLTIFRLHF